MKRRPFKRTFNVRRIKTNISYTYEEAADLLTIHKNTLTHWEAEGLKVMRDVRPYLIHGSALIEFITNRQKARKRKCRPDQFYCCKCQTPTTSYEGITDIKILSPIKLQLIGLCPICDGKVLKFGLTAKLPEYQKTFVIQMIHDEHLMEASHPSANCD